MPLARSDKPYQQPIRLARLPGGYNLLLGLVLLVGMGLVFLGVSGCALRGLPPDDLPWVPFTPPLTPTPNRTPTPTPTPTPTLTPSPEFPSGSATILRMQGQMSVQVTGHPPQVAEPGLTIPASGEPVVITSGIAELELSDGTQVFLGENTTVTLVSVAGPSGLDTVIQMQQGNLLVGAAQLTIRASTAETDNPFQAQLTHGWMGVTYQPAADLPSAGSQFLVDCLSGACLVGDLALSGGQRGGLIDSILRGPEDAQYDFWQALNLFEVLPFTPTLATTSTPTPSLTPTHLAIPSVPPTLAPTKTPKEEPANPPAPPTPKPTATSTSVPVATDTPTSASPP